MNEATPSWGPAQAQALEYAWGEYRVWAASAREKKEEISHWKLRVLLFSVAGALLGTLSSQFSGLTSRLIGLGGSGLIAAAAYLGQEILKPDQERLWVRTRSMAEALKALTYLFRTGAPPFNVPEAAPILMQRVRELLDQVKDLPAIVLSQDQKLEKLPKGLLTGEEYVTERLEDQVDGFYKPKVQEYQGILKQWRLANFGVGLLAAVLGILGEWAAAWVAVLTTVGTSIAAYLFANRYQYLLISYQATARQLEFFKNEWRMMGAPEQDPEKRNRFILNCEAAIATENSAWMANWLEKPKEA